MIQPGPMTKLLALYDEVDGLCEAYNPNAVASIRELSRVKKAQVGATIMVYGVYNAGKSTLINALLGQWLQLLTYPRRPVCGILVGISKWSTPPVLMPRLSMRRSPADS